MRTFILLLFPTLLFAQDKDLIISKSLDTMTCTISKVGKSSLYYTQDGGGTRIMALNKIYTYSRNGIEEESHSIVSDCEYVTNEIDKFTKTKKLSTKPVKLIGNMSTTIFASGVVIGEYKILKLHISTFGIMSIDKGSKLMLMTKNDSVISLYNIEYIVSEATGSGGATIWYMAVRYAISQEELKYLISNKITDFRYYTNKGYVDIAVKEKLVPAFQHILRCIQ